MSCAVAVGSVVETRVYDFDSVRGNLVYRNTKTNDIPDVSFERVDGLPTLGLEGDEDADLIDDADDNCPTVWNPDQAEAEEGVGQACSP